MSVVIIAGSRDIYDYAYLCACITSLDIQITKIISGGARGVDSLGERYARDNSIPLLIMRADWDRFGRSAGYKRNEQMAELGQVLIALWDGQSRGTMHMINIAKARGLTVHVFRV
jgi:YspA, cpYpsA-related SLOG family